MLTALTLVAPERLEEAIAALYHAFFVEHRLIAKLENILPILEAALGKEVAAEAVARVLHQYGL